MATEALARGRQLVRARVRWLKRQIRGLPFDDAELARTVSDRVGTSDLDAGVKEIVTKVRPYTLTSVERVAALCAGIDYIVQNAIPGPIVECGLWKGGSLMAAALRLLDHRDTGRDLIGFDTFGGMTRPTEADVSFKGRPELERWRPSPPSPPGSGQHPDDIRALLKSTGWPASHIRLVVGPVEETVPADAPDQIALLRLDTDWYESTRHELEHLYPRLLVGGVLIIDDYGHYKGAQKAVDEYFRDHQIFLHRIDYSGRIAIKHAPPQS
jgi:O-methyltransferase